MTGYLILAAALAPFVVALIRLWRYDPYRQERRRAQRALRAEKRRFT